MKTVRSLVLALAVMVMPGGLFAQQENMTVTTTETAGTISAFGPETIMIRTETSSSPTSYSYTKSTSYVDETGAPVSLETVKSGLPVTVYYTRDGDRMIAEKVMVRKTTTTTTTGSSAGEKQTSTITETAGTVSEFGPDTIMIRTETSSSPTSYSYTKSTSYVDETGAPVSMETVKSGLPVTVYYTRDGDRMIAEKVMVRKTTTTTTTENPAIEKHTSTTTTRTSTHTKQE